MPYKESLSRNIRIAFGLIAVLGLLVLTASPIWSADAEIADAVYQNGPILTLESDGETVEALATRDGLILATGTRASLEPHVGPDTRQIDLKGRTLMPAFVDGHGHFTFFASLVDGVNISSPPAGPMKNHAQIVAALKKRIADEKIPPGETVFGWGYDDSLLAEGTHPDRDTLDQASTEHPIVLVHVSGHLATTNSKALKDFNYTAETADPPGGVLRRRPGSQEPNGVLEENAMMPAFGFLMGGSPEEKINQLVRSQQQVFAKGITTVQDGATSPESFALLSAAADRELLEIDVVTLPITSAYDAIAETGPPPMEYRNRLMIGGAKLILDGSPQGKTAYFRDPYFVPPPGRDAAYRGYPRIEQDEVDATFTKFADLGVPLYTHANGDASADMFVEGLKKAMAGREEIPNLNVMIHAPLVLEEHLDAMKQYGAVPSLFTAHVFYWGDFHRDSVMGPERASHLSPTRWAQDRGLLFNMHTDTPIVPYDQFHLVWSAVERKTRSGKTLGPDQKLTVHEALRAVTYNPAWAYGEADRKGTLSAGKLADMILVSENPYTVDPSEIPDIEILATWKEDRLVHEQRNAKQPLTPSSENKP
ncbi:MAG: amidohydrolase family protein [Myxococcota bacterium]|nr:amidohydrolase family protein [Myxococcota bacterium]